ncbi:MAG TPA: sigma factor, partial [Kofleriaceae bacterium]
MPPVAEQLLRELTPHVLGAVVRRHGDFGAAEDAVQEALVAAAIHWPVEGIPDNPRGWLIHVAGRRMIDHVRTEAARRRRETTAMRDADDGDPGPSADPVAEEDP